jgi:CTP:molybdopterin cytidylyltransferase MocA
MSDMTSIITKAVFPVAGLGTRFLPATKASPKEMLPVVDKPLIQYAVEEAVAAGITELVFITGRSKRAIEDHFDKAFEVESELTSRGKHAMLAMVRDVVPSHVKCIYVRQQEALGLGHAVLCAQPVVGDQPFAVMLADDLIDAKPPVMKQMVDVYRRERCSLLGVQQIARAENAPVRHRQAGPPRRQPASRTGDRGKTRRGKSAIAARRRRPLHPVAPHISSSANHQARRGRRNPAHRRHRRAVARRARARAPVRRACATTAAANSVI